jgi:hypothetical protein
MSDIDPAVQVHIDAANLAESQGNHQARSASASEEFERITATIVLGNAMMDKFARGLP